MLSALNPLQYLPGIGTIYRAFTGDQIPEAVRRIGSLAVSGLLGGPIGIVINIAITLAEKITGIDLDQTGQTLLTGNHHTRPPARAPTPAPAPAAVAHAQAPAPAALPRPRRSRPGHRPNSRPMASAPPLTAPSKWPISAALMC